MRQPAPDDGSAMNGLKRKLSPTAHDEQQQQQQQQHPTPTALAPPPVLAPIAPPRAPPAHCAWTSAAPIRATRLEGGVRALALSGDGALFALLGDAHPACVHVWDNAMHVEAARLEHAARVLCVAWAESEDGVALATLCENGAVFRWTRSVRVGLPTRREEADCVCVQAAGGHWKCGKVAEVNREEREGAAAPDLPITLAHSRDRVAAAFTRSGVRIWMYNDRGTEHRYPSLFVQR